MPTPTNFEGINPRGTQTFIPCKDAKAQNGVIANTKLIKDTVGWSGQNKLPNVYTGGSSNGITYTVGADKSISASNNTATGLSGADVNTITLPAGNYIFSGCPSGGSTSTYYMNAIFDGADHFDTGEGVSFSLSAATSIRVVFRILSGVSGNGKVFKPMIRLADILDSTYEPYFGSTAFPRSEQAVLGARQWLDKSKAVADSGVLLEQIATGIRVYNTTAKTYSAVRIPCTFKSNTDYRIKADIDHTSGVGHVTLQYSDDGSTWASVIDVPKDYSADESLDVSFNSGSHAYYRLSLYSTRGTSATGDVSYKNLIIVLASDDTTAYSDYAMTNKELTDAVTIHNNAPVVIASAGSSQTWKAQMEIIHAAYLELTDVQKARCYIGVGQNNDGTYRNNARGIACFTLVSLSGSSDIVIQSLRLSNQKAAKVTITSAGAISYEDLSNTTNGANMYLYFE